MRILEMVSQYERNGAMIYARRIIPLLRARGHEVWLAARPDSWIARETAGEAIGQPMVPAGVELRDDLVRVGAHAGSEDGCRFT